MILQLILGAPPWVWPLLALLLWLGFSATRRRMVPIWRVFLLPALGLINLMTVLRAGPEDVVWALYALAYGLGVVLGARLQRRWLLGRLGGKVELAGEWLTLATVSGLFVANYAFNVVSVIRPDVAALRGTLMCSILVVGPLSGSLLGRALHVARGAVRP